MSELTPLNGWRPLQAGDQVWAPVTDHPDFPPERHEGESYSFRDRETAERICAAWNSYGGAWTWYAKEFTLRPRRAPEPEQDGGLGLEWDEEEEGEL